MRSVFGGLAGVAVVLFAVSLCYADEGEVGGLKFSLDVFSTQGEAPKKAEVTIGGWGQFRFDYSNGTYSVADGRPTGGDETYRAWRFRFIPKVKYDYLSFGCQYETAPTLTLLDFWANLACKKHKEALQLKLGQFIPPFGMQRPISPYKILTINYSKIVAYLFGGSDPIYPTWGNLRDTGLMVHGKVKLGGEGKGFQPHMLYYLGTFTGEAANTTNSDPAFTTFVGVKLVPADGVLLGLSCEDGSRQFVDTTIPIDRQVNRDRYGICWKFEFMKDEKTKSKLLLIQGEWISGCHNMADMDKHDDELNPVTYLHNNRQKVEGWYLEVGLFIKPAKVQLMGKVDILDLPSYNPWTDTRGSEHDIHYRKQRMYGVGLNWYINPHCKLQIMIQQSQNEGRAKIHKIAGSETRGYALFGVNF